MSVRVGQQLELDVERPVYRGLGLARHDGRVVLVERGLPGERVRVEVTEVHRSYLKAAVADVLRPAAGRRPSPCPAFPACGGCTYQELDYETQLAAKRAVVIDALEHAGVPAPGELEIVASPERGWRTRAELHVSGSGDALQAGFFETGSRRLVGVDACPQLSDGANRALASLVAALRGAPAGIGSRVEAISILEDVEGKSRVASLHTSFDGAAAARLAGPLGDAAGFAGLSVVTRSRRRDGGAQQLRGTPFVTMRVDPCRYRVHAESFFQGNRFLTETLVDDVVGRIPPGGSALDLYAGVGLFALRLAATCESVDAIEGSRWSSADAEDNVREAGVTNVRVRRADVGAALDALPPRANETAVVDPPRGGLGAPIVEALVGRAPRRVVYVSCDPPALARDLALFREAGYKTRDLRGLDMFPDTFHVETVCHLERS